MSTDAVAHGTSWTEDEYLALGETPIEWNSSTGDYQ
jgi:hypothetical protein